MSCFRELASSSRISACPAGRLVRFHNKRGTVEQWIKEGKQATHWTLLSCHRFRANEARLQLSLLAYNLGNLWRRHVLPKRIDNWSLTSLQQRLVNGRASGETHTVLLAVTGRKSPDPTPVRDDVAADLGVAGTHRVVLGLRARNVRPREKGRSGCLRNRSRQQALLVRRARRSGGTPPMSMEPVLLRNSLWRGHRRSRICQKWS